MIRHVECFCLEHCGDWTIELGLPMHYLYLRLCGGKRQPDSLLTPFWSSQQQGGWEMRYVTRSNQVLDLIGHLIDDPSIFFVFSA